MMRAVRKEVITRKKKRVDLYVATYLNCQGGR
jgi:hypothetical protein